LATLYWCCTMANNQHDLAELKDGDILQSPFARVLTSQECVGTVLLCDAAVTPMRRVWCVFEVHLTEALRSRRICKKDGHLLDVAASVSVEQCRTTCSGLKPAEMSTVGDPALLQDASNGHWQECSSAQGLYFPLEVARVGTQVDIAKATASVESDRNAILNYVATGAAKRSPPPTVHTQYDGLNAFIHGIFASAELYRLACERPTGCVEQARRLLQLRGDPNKFVRAGNTALFAAVGADPAVPNNLGSIGDGISLLELLLDSRADPNIVNSKGLTVIDCAHHLSRDAVDLLHRYRAKPIEEVAAVHEELINQELEKVLNKGFASESLAFWWYWWRRRRGKAA